MGFGCATEMLPNRDGMIGLKPKSVTDLGELDLGNDPISTLVIECILILLDPTIVSEIGDPTQENHSFFQP